jgi:hypothetical protein
LARVIRAASTWRQAGGGGAGGRRLTFVDIPPHDTRVHSRPTHPRSRVRFQKPVVTYDLGKFSVTNCARLPNYF